MPTYIPIYSGFPLQASRSDLVNFQWHVNGVVADFLLPGDDGHLLRVTFGKGCIVRLLDEMPLSTEDDDTPNKGRVPEHFAYRVEGAAFSRTQSETWKSVFGPVAHYQLVTGSACMDILSGAAPSFSIVAKS
ncbi:MAG TPA: hypothetical protein VGF77_09640 [Allosphingosinicella sp.]|jgi:hypothetical protein